MFDQSISQNIFPSVLGTARCILLPSVRWPPAMERIELFPAPRGKYSGLLTSQTLNNCILYHTTDLGTLSVYLSIVNTNKVSTVNIRKVIAFNQALWEYFDKITYVQR